jgi:glycosyltransferase involved in cell wall biosynthesis
MRVLADYRPALRERSGVGEHLHLLIGGYAAAYPGDVTLFTSSWKDRPRPDLAAELGVRVVDRRIPVSVLNLLWHRAGWPPIEMLTGDRFDVVHSPHPLRIPSRSAAQVVTVHDLFFLDDPERTSAEIRRDYPALAALHARQAHAILTSSEYVKQRICRRLGALPDHVYVCGPGAPAWRDLGRAPNIPRDGYLLFVGTLEPRKNLGALLDAYAILLTSRPHVPDLLIVGRPTPAAQPWLERIAAPPLAGRVRLAGYLGEGEREATYAGARALVLPSLDEGFGLPVLEAMSAGIPVVASNRGSLPEVIGHGGVLVDPTRPDLLADALMPMLFDDSVAARWALAGLERARAFSWASSVATLRRAYLDAVTRRSGRHPDEGNPAA